MLTTQKFDLKIQSEFQKCMKDLEWLSKTWQQLVKEFELSGIEPPEKNQTLSVDAMLKELMLKLEDIGKQPQSFSQLLYRIDLPKQLIIENLSINELAEIIILRSFQKVWLRKYYSK